MTSGERASRAFRLAVAVTTTAALSLVYAGTRAEAAPAVAAASGPSTAGALLLQAPDAAALRTLAARPVANRGQRLAAVEALLPGATQRATVLSNLKSLGFTV